MGDREDATCGWEIDNAIGEVQSISDAGDELV
jgi:hypothetical protein